MIVFFALSFSDSSPWEITRRIPAITMSTTATRAMKFKTALRISMITVRMSALVPMISGILPMPLAAHALPEKSMLAAKAEQRLSVERMEIMEQGKEVTKLHSLLHLPFFLRKDAECHRSCNRLTENRKKFVVIENSNLCSGDQRRAGPKRVKQTRGRAVRA